MPRSLLVLAVALTLALPASASALVNPFPAGSNWILSGNSALDAGLPTPANYSENGPDSVSADGRYVAFSSSADGLSAEDDDAVNQIFVKDRQTGAVTLVSRASGSGPSSSGGCGDPAISADGTRVAFFCLDAFAVEDTNSNYDVYVRDWQTGTPTTTLVSRKTGLGAVVAEGSFDPSLSADGEYVAFTSYGPLDDADNNGDSDVYRRRIGSGDGVSLASRKAGNGAVGNNDSQSPSISDDGTKVAFDSNATNLLAAATTQRNVFVAQPDGLTIARASAITNVDDEPNGDSYDAVISGDGTRVAFTSQASNLNNGDNDTASDVHRRTITGGGLTLWISSQAGAGDAISAGIDADGSVVGYVWTVGGASVTNAFVLDGATTVLISRRDGDAGTPADAGSVGAPALSADGQLAVFTVGGLALTNDADLRFGAVYARDRSADPDSTSLVSRPAGSAAFVNEGAEAALQTGERSISGDGRRVVFRRVVGQNSYELVVRSTDTGALTIAGRADGADGAIDPRAYSGSISADGNRVAWATDTPVDPVLDVNDKSDIYVRDIAANRTFLVSRADGPDGVGGEDSSYAPVIDADGSRIAFTSYSDNLGDGDATDNLDVHVRDLASGDTFLASGKDGADPVTGNGQVDGRPAISADGTKVAFSTSSSDLGDGDADAGRDIHLRDLVAGTTRQVSATPGGSSGGGHSTHPAMSADGNRIAFGSSATDLIEDYPGSGNVYVRDLAANTLIMAGRASGADGTPAAEVSRYPQLSDDGRLLLFASFSDNLGVTIDGEQAFLRNLDTLETTLVTRGADGNSVKGGVDGQSISGNGSCVVWSSGGGVIASPVSPDFDQVYLRAVGPACVPAPASTPAPPVAGSDPPPAAAADTVKPVLTKVSLLRKRFRVARRATAISAARAKAGTALRLTLSEAATLTVRIQRARPGKKVGKRCKRVPRKVKRNACIAWRTSGTLSRKVTKAGRYRMAFSGRIGKRKLAPGRYRMVIRAADSAGNRAAVARLRFRIVR